MKNGKDILSTSMMMNRPKQANGGYLLVYTSTVTRGDGEAETAQTNGTAVALAQLTLHSVTRRPRLRLRLPRFQAKLKSATRSATPTAPTSPLLPSPRYNHSLSAAADQGAARLSHGDRRPGEGPGGVPAVCGLVRQRGRGAALVAVARAHRARRLRRGLRRRDVRQRLPAPREPPRRRRDLHRRGVPPPVRLPAAPREPTPRPLLRHVSILLGICFRIRRIVGFDAKLGPGNGEFYPYVGFRRFLM